MDTAAFWNSKSVGELAAEQRVSAPESFEDVLGGWPADEIDDGFDQAVMEWRRSDGEHRG